MKRILSVIATALAVAVMASPATAAYPERPIRLVVPFGPGGGTDILARLVADRLGRSIGGTVVVENKPGAGSTIGSDFVAKSRPDGYTLLMATNATLALAPGLYPKLPFDPLKDFIPVALVASGPSIMVVHPSLPADSVAKLVEYAKANPGKLNYGSAGNGTMAHIATELFSRTAGTQAVHIPFKGGAAATQELVAGRLQFMIAGPVETVPLIQAGTVRGLAVTTRNRFPSLPNLPTIAESGLPGYEIANWFGVVAPAGTPADIVGLLSTRIGELLAAADVKETLLRQGVEARPMDAAAFGEFARAEIVKWTREVQQMGIKLD